MEGGLAISQLRRHDAGFFLKSTGNGRLNVVDGTMQPAPDSLRKARSSHSISSGAAVDSHSERDPRISSGTAVDSVQARSLPGGSVHGERANFTGLVLGCIETKVCKY